MSTPTLPTLPSLPRAAKRNRVQVPCACGGCGRLTKSTWFPGHDGYCTGWAVRLERGAVKVADIPAVVVAGVRRMWVARNPGAAWPEAPASK